MDIDVKEVDQVTVIELVGDVDTNTAPEIQGRILPIVQDGSKILMNLTEVAYMSSAGLRMLLSLYRRLLSQNGNLVLLGLNEEIRDTMEVTGFLSFFETCETLGAGLESLNQLREEK